MKTLAIIFSISALALSGCTFLGTDRVERMEESMDERMDEMDEHMEGMMDHGRMTSDAAFLAMMIPHHQEAIDTSKIILANSENEELKALAEGIIDAQTAEIAQMEAWGAEWFGTSFEPSDDYAAMMSDLSDLEGDALDQAYIAGMIHHHEGAIQMAEDIKGATDRPELLEMADAIIEAQTSEVELLKSWLK